MSGREVGSPVAQDLVGRGVRAERPAHRDDRCCSHPNTRIGIFSVDWFQIETKFYFGNHWRKNRDFYVTKCSKSVYSAHSNKLGQMFNRIVFFKF